MSVSLQSPKVELITIGREILDGRVVDTNAVKMAELLKTQGLIVRHAQRVDDHLEQIIDAFKLAQSRSSIILVTGGLGPTSDDITMEALAKFMGVDCLENSEAYQHLEKFLQARSRPMTPAQKKQACLPQGVKVINNPLGTACGVFVEISASHSCLWAFMPGVPLEMIPMLKNDILPLLPKVDGYKTYSWATQFIAEADLQDQLSSLILSNTKFEISFRTRFPENHIGLHGVVESDAEKKAYEELKLNFSKTLSPHLFSEGENLENLENVVLKLAKQNQFWMSCVESCTGGLISKRITSIPGSSNHFFANWTPYHNEAKVLLGVEREKIQNLGAVSEPIARDLAKAGLEKMREGLPHAQNLICVSTTGIAGPDGGTTEKPVGLCWIAMAKQKDSQSPIELQSHRVQASVGWDRERYQNYFSQKALDLLRRSMKN